jgi:hypothetical protein
MPSESQATAGTGVAGPLTHLARAGLLDVHGGAAQVSDLSRSHLVASVRLGDGRHLVVKRARPRPGERWGSLGRELSVYRLTRECGALAAALPTLVWADPLRQVLVMEAVEPGTPLHASAVALGAPASVQAQRLGAVVGGWHRDTGSLARKSRDRRAAGGVDRLVPPGTPPVEMPWVLHILAPGGWGPPVTERLLDLGAVRRELRAHFAELAQGLVPSGLVHGDLKWDNCVSDGDNGVRVIDWEHAAIGDPAWDVAGILQDHVVVRRTRLQQGRYTDDVWAGMGEATADFLGGYLRTAPAEGGRPGFLERAARLAGARLVQTALEYASVSADHRLARALLGDALLVLRDGSRLLPAGVA